MSALSDLVLEELSSPSQNLAMCYSQDDRSWIGRKAREIARETGEPLSVARAEAMVEFVRMQQKPNASVVAVSQGRLFAIPGPELSVGKPIVRRAGAMPVAGLYRDGESALKIDRRCEAVGMSGAAIVYCDQQSAFAFPQSDASLAPNSS